MAKSAVDRASSEFQKGLIRFCEKLKRRANGKTCGTCRFYIRGLCIEKDVDVIIEDAVACEFHEEKEDARPDLRPIRRPE